MIDAKKSLRLYLLLFVMFFSVFSFSAQARQYTEKEMRAMGIYFVNLSSGTPASTSVSGPAGGSGSCYELAFPQVNDLAVFAKTIDDYIRSEAPSSPFIGLGADIVKGAQKWGVNPMFVVGNMKMESRYGTTGTSGHSTLASQLHDAFNAFGRTAPRPSQPHFTASNGRTWYKYPSWKDSVNSPTSSLTNTTDQPSLMRTVYLDDGLLTIGQYLGRYAPASDGNDESVYGKLLNDVISSLIELSGSSLSCTDNSTTITPAPQGGNTTGGNTNEPI